MSGQTQKSLTLYYFNAAGIPLTARWDEEFERCARMGFSYALIGNIAGYSAGNPIVDDSAADAGCRGTAKTVEALAAAALRHGLEVVLDLESRAGRIATASGISNNSKTPAEEIQAERLTHLLEAGAAGFLFHPATPASASAWLASIAMLKRHASPFLLAWTPGVPRPSVLTFQGHGLDAVFSSVAWWDGRASWLVEEYEALRQVGRVVGFPESPFGNRLGRESGTPEAACRHALSAAAATGNGLLIPMGFEFGLTRPLQAIRSASDWEDERAASRIDLSDAIVEANARVKRLAKFAGEMRLLASGTGCPTALLRCDRADVRGASEAIAILLNPDLRTEQKTCGILSPVPSAAGASFTASGLDGAAPLAPGEVRVGLLRRNRQAATRRPPRSANLGYAATAPRISIEAISPSVDGGRFAAKRCVGERIEVSADIFIDGHGREIAAAVLWRGAGAREWNRAPMVRHENDRWRGWFALDQIGPHVFTVEAWEAPYETFANELEKKHEAKLDLTLEVREGYELARALSGPLSLNDVDFPSGPAFAALSQERQVQLLLDARLRKAITENGRKHFLIRHEPPLPLEAERPQANFASWYEMFPRSATTDANRHGTFDDVINRLPAIRAMGFDVLYMPPIHPIGETNRKGRNNSLEAGESDPGSPYAIGSAEGGHTAIHAQLGTFEDFRRLRDAAAEQGLEIALDFAIQCSPDHPWLKEHPEWFKWRADGSVRHAENPPKKYEDIVNAEFYAGQALPALWTALRDVVLFWIKEGVRTFRVDNPHTKPFPFWEWLISSVRAQHPDVIFLAEAFTRPALMYRLAKIGFSQSYTYFIWRNTKRELTEYLTELTATNAREFFRPHFFVNTPDINPVFLQTSGRGGFLIRAALASTLSGLWGMYSGFELCEAAPLPGREEYLDSEKYEIRVRDYEAPGNIVAEISALNRIRKANPALQSHRGLTFYNAQNDEVLVYGKSQPHCLDKILVAVSLDPRGVQEATFEIPLWEWGLPDHGKAAVENLMTGERFIWTGKLQRVRLDPTRLPFSIWRLSPLDEVRT